MNEKNLIIICITIVICVGIISAAIVMLNINNNSSNTPIVNDTNSTNKSVNSNNISESNNLTKNESSSDIITLKPTYEWKTKSVGKYRIEYRLWSMEGTTLGGDDLDIILYKNGKQLDRYEYLTNFCYKEGGKWKWSGWMHGDVDHAYHRYEYIQYPVFKFKIKLP